MTFSESKKWLENNGYKYETIWLSFVPPNTLVYKNKEGKLAYLNEEEYGELIVDGADISNNNTLSLFRLIIESKTNPS